MNLKYIYYTYVTLPPGLRPCSSACALTYLGLPRCQLGQLAHPAEARLPCSLGVVNLEDNPSLDVAAWLPVLTSLQQCHSVDLSSKSRSPLHTLEYNVTAAASLAFAAFFVSPALRILVCDQTCTAPLMNERASKGLPPITVSNFQHQEVWSSYRAAVAAPAIRLGSLAVLPDPQVKRTSCCFFPAINS